MILLHNLVNAIKDESRLRVVGFHRLIDNFGKRRIITYKEPRINRYAMPSHSWARLQDIHSRMHIANPYDFIHIHIVVPTDTRQFIGKSNIYSPERIFDNFCHLGRTNVCDYNLALTETGIVLFHALTDLTAIGSNSTIIVEEFIDHIARNDTLRGVDQVHILTYYQPALCDNWPNGAIHSSRTDGRFYDDCCTFWAHLQNFFYGCYHILRINFF